MRGRYLGTIVLIELLVAALLSWRLGEPAKLPGVALDSGFVFVAYRALLIFFASYIVTVVIVMSFTGSLASKVGTGGIEWGSKDAADTATEQMLKLNLRLDDQQSFVQNVVVRLIEDKARHDDLARDLQRMDRELQRAVVELRQIGRREAG